MEMKVENPKTDAVMATNDHISYHNDRMSLL